MKYSKKLLLWCGILTIVFSTFSFALVYFLRDAMYNYIVDSINNYSGGEMFQPLIDMYDIVFDKTNASLVFSFVVGIVFAIGYFVFAKKSNESLIKNKALLIVFCVCSSIFNFNLIILILYILVIVEILNFEKKNKDGVVVHGDSFNTATKNTNQSIQSVGGDEVLRAEIQKLRALKEKDAISEEEYKELLLEKIKTNK